MSTYALIKDGVVENIVVWDGTGDIFDGLVIIQLQDDLVGIGWLYADGKFTNPNEPQPPTPEELISAANADKQSRIDQANAYMNGKQWPGKAAVGRLKGDELAQYNLWLDYLDELEVVDTSKAPDITWPTPPAA